MNKIVNIHPCDDNNQVVTVVRGKGEGPFLYRRAPCAECPWRKDRPRRAFPAEAYRHSAATAQDMAGTTFACHMSGIEKTQTCAGFLLSKDAAHNMLLRMAASSGRYDWRSITDGGLKLYPSYFAMAVANGVRRDDPALQMLRRDCR